MATNNRICAVCGKAYRYCGNCQDDYLKPTWMIMFHDENCHEIFKLLSDVTNKKVTEEEAKNILATKDLSNIDSFDEDIKNQIRKIMGMENCTKEVDEHSTVTTVQSNNNATKANYKTRKKK